MPMRVLHICSYYSSPLYRLLFDALAQHGVEQEVFYFAVRGTEYDSRESDVCFSCCYNNFDRLFFSRKEKKAVESLYRNIDVSSFGILHAHSLFTNGFLALDAKQRLGIPYIVAVRNTDVNSFFRVRPWLRRMGVRIMQEAKFVVFLSPAYKRAVIDCFVPRNMRDSIEQKCCVIPNGISEVFFDSAPIAPRKPDEIIRVVQVGAVNRNKNQLTVAKACSEIVKRGRKVSYTVVGKVHDRRVASKLARYGFVEFLPPMTQRDLIDVYRGSDVFAMPSIHETFGLVYVEAMSQGLPVVYTKGQGFDGWLSNEGLGRAVYAHDIKGIQDAILSLKFERSSAQFAELLNISKRFRWSDVSLLYLERYTEANTHVFC